MKISATGLDMLKKWEGSVTEGDVHVPYDDETGEPVKEGEDWRGYLTIGYGHLLDKSELNLEMVEIDGKQYNFWAGLTEDLALKLLDEDLDWAEYEVNKRVTVPLNQNQFDALVSFTFNVGAGAFKGSTLLRVLNQGHYDEVPDQLKRWNKTGGRVSNGLIKRRQKEIDLWNR